MGPGTQAAPGVVFWAQAGLVEATMASTSRDWAGIMMCRGSERLRASLPAAAMRTADWGSDWGAER